MTDTLMQSLQDRWEAWHRKRLHRHLDLYASTKDRLHYYLAINSIDALSYAARTRFRLKGHHYSWEAITVANP